MSSDGNGGGFECPIPLTSADAILMGHGSGGKLTARLVEQTIVPALRNPHLERLDDQAFVPIEGGRIAFTTDSFVVKSWSIHRTQETHTALLHLLWDAVHVALGADDVC